MTFKKVLTLQGKINLMHNGRWVVISNYRVTILDISTDGKIKQALIHDAPINQEMLEQIESPEDWPLKHLPEPTRQVTTEELVILETYIASEYSYRPLQERQKLRDILHQILGFTRIRWFGWF